MAAAETGAAQRSAMQDYKSCCLFFSQALWDTLLAEPAPSALQRVDAVVGYLVGTLGLRHPSEPTVAVITAVCAAGAEQSGMQLQSLFVTVKSQANGAARSVLRRWPAGVCCCISDDAYCADGTGGNGHPPRADRTHGTLRAKCHIVPPPSLLCRYHHISNIARQTLSTSARFSLQVLKLHGHMCMPRSHFVATALTVVHLTLHAASKF